MWATELDEGKCDGKFYHVKNDDFADYRPLEDPETVLDNYLLRVDAVTRRV